MCGGNVGDGRQCYHYNTTKTVWVTAGRLSSRRRHAAYSVHPALGLLITGGNDGRSTLLATVESTTDGVEFKRDYADMPQGTYSHCQVLVDRNTLMVLGGYDGTSGPTNRVDQLKIR